MDYDGISVPFSPGEGVGFKGWVFIFPESSYIHGVGISDTQTNMFSFNTEDGSGEEIVKGVSQPIILGMVRNGSTMEGTEVISLEVQGYEYIGQFL